MRERLMGCCEERASSTLKDYIVDTLVLCRSISKIVLGRFLNRRKFFMVAEASFAVTAL